MWKLNKKDSKISPKPKRYRIIKTQRGYLAQFKPYYIGSSWESMERNLLSNDIQTSNCASYIEEWKEHFYTSKKDCTKRIAEHISLIAFEKISQHLHDEKFIREEPIESILVNIYEREEI